MRRRDLLRAGMAGAAVGPWVLRNSWAADSWGKLTDNPWGATEGSSPIKRVLEIYIYGGLSPWETFYLNPKMGIGGGTGKCVATPSCPAQGSKSNGNLQWGLFQCEFENIIRQNSATAPISKLFANNIHLGGATRDLWRDDLFNRLRVLVCSHDLLPHEAAIPFCLTGTRLGKSTMAGTGAAVERRFGGGGTPVAFVIKPKGDTPSDNIKSALAVGEHPASTRPLLIEPDCGGPDFTLLDRTATPDQDELLKFYRNQYKARLTRVGESQPVRNRAFNEYSSMVDSFFNTSSLKGTLGGYDKNDPLLGGTELKCVTDVSPRCGDPFSADKVRQSLDFGAFLLRQPSTKYVCVVDIGRQESSNAGYDTHGPDLAQNIFRNLGSTLGLLAKLTDPGTPANPKTPAIPADTLIVLTTEFGRS